MAHYGITTVLSIILAVTRGMAQTITQNDVDNVITKTMARFDLPAMAVTVMNNEQVYIRSFHGVRRLNSNEVINEDDFFHIGSCSKSVLAVIAGKFVEQGKIAWNTKFFSLYPELKSTSNAEYFNITLENMLVCEAGIKPFTTSEEVFPSIDSCLLIKRYHFAAWVLRQPASSKKNEEGKFAHRYSNAGYTLAALMLERVSGVSWEDLVNRMMEECALKICFGFPVETHAQQPWGHGYFDYDVQNNIGVPRKTLTPFGPGNAYRLNKLIAPAGDLSMPVMDYARYTQLHLQGLTGTGNYLRKETWRHIHFFRKGFSLGVGNSVYYGKEIVGFDGSAGTFYCRSIIIPNDNLAFTIMTNSGSRQAVDKVTMKIVKKYYGWWWKVWM